MRLAIAIALAACATERPGAPARDAGRDAPGSASRDAPPEPPAFSMIVERPVVAMPPPKLPAIEPVPVSVPQRSAAEAIPAVHGSAIAALALTEDGRAAATADLFGAVRLWPALDGSLEPVAVAASHPVQLAIVRDGSPGATGAPGAAGEHFAIAALDRAGSLEILAVRATGAGVWRSRIDEARPIASVVAMADSFIATTDDQRIAVIGLDGTLRGHLVPEPGERVVAIAPRGLQALALISTGGAIRGRWITKSGWGGTTPKLPIDPSHAALSPDLSRIAAQRADRQGVVIVSLQTGRVIEKIGAQDGSESGRFPFGYIDAHQVALADGFQLDFATAGEVGPPITGGDDRDRMSTIAAADGVAVWARGASLVIATPNGAKHLGYKLSAPSDFRVIERGMLLTDGATLVRVDDRFAERERYPIPSGMWSVIPIDAHRVLASTTTARGSDLLALDLDDPDDSKLLVHGVSGPLQYQPATHLYAVVGQTHISVGRYDPRTGAFEGPIEVPVEAPGAQIALPPRGAPLVVVDLRARDQQIAITEIRGLDFAKHEFTAGATRTQELPDDFGTPAMLERLGLVSPERRAHGTLVAELARGRITLRDGGAVRWVVPAHGVTQLAWSERGALIAFGNGLAHLDLATGAVTGPHCGWGFGLWDDTSRFAGFAETLCDAPRE